MPVTPTSPPTEPLEHGAVDQHRRPPVANDPSATLPPGQQLNPQPSRPRPKVNTDTESINSAIMAATTISSPYTAAAATATTTDEADAYIAAEPIFRRMRPSLLMIIAEGKANPKFLEQQKLGTIPSDIAASMAWYEIGRKKQLWDLLKAVIGPMAVVLAALISALVVLWKT